MDVQMQPHAGSAAARALKKQSNSDEQAPQHRGKTSSTTRPTGPTNASNTASHTAQKRQATEGQSPMLTNDGSTHAQRRLDKQSLALEMVAVDSNEGITDDVGAEQPDGLYYQMAPYAPGSASGGGGKQGKSTMSDGMDRRHTNAMAVSQSIGAGGGSAVSQGTHHPLSNKSDANMSAGTGNQHGFAPSNQTASRGRASGHGLSNGRAAGHSQNADGKRKRKSSEKGQRRASNNRRGDARDEEKNNRDPNGVMIPPIDAFPGNAPAGSAGGPGSASQTRSQSRGTAGAGNPQMQPPTASQLLQQQYYSGAQDGAFQLFGQGLAGQEQAQAPGFGVNMNGLGLGGVNINGHSNFPFGNAGAGSFMGGSNQAPQVHFIAKKQQFIAQISPEQLLAGDKRPYTAQSLNNLSQSAKRAGGVYANGGGKASSHGAGYHLANAAFTSQPAVYLGQVGGASRTHTNGFSFHPPHGTNIHKYSNSLYGDDVKPKVAGKDVLHALGSSNGFSSGYSSDPYNSVMSSGLPATLSHSNRPAKAKATHNRLQTKEKEQLYDETIKMKMLNNQLRDDSVKLKTKIKILENELNRKEKTIEDLFSHNQLIQQSHSKNSSSNSNQSLLPLAQTAQKYQQETFLVMSLKKQIRELKYEVVKRDEELEVLRKNIRNTKTKEMEQEIQTYREECLRQRAIMEDLLKQGAAHPIHQRAFHDRVTQMQAELQRKDAMIQQLTDSMNQSMKGDPGSYHSGQSSGPTGAGPTSSGGGNALAVPTHSASLAAVRSQESQQLESSPSAAEVGTGQQSVANTHPTGQSAQGQPQQMPGRDKSAERKGGAMAGNQYPGAAANTKEIQRDLQRARKAVREKDKEILKLKTEINHIRRESQEKLKSESQHNKDSESQVKQLREKQRDLKMDLKRRDDKLSEAELKAKRLEEQFKEVNDALKAQEEANKQLRSQLRAAKNQKQSSKTTESKTTPAATGSSKDDKKEKERDKDKDAGPNKDKEDKESHGLKTEPSEPTPLASRKEDKKEPPKAELQLITLIGQREKLSRDDLTAMMLAGEESLKMLIRKPSEQLIDFIKSHLDDEDAILVAIPRFEMPKSDFESQVLREMRLVLRENADKITDKSSEELMKWTDFEEFYNGLDNFEYPHKDKLLDFIKYFFLDHIESADSLQMNYQAFKEHVSAKRPFLASAERTRNASALRSRRKSGDSASYSASADDSTKRRLLGMSDDEKVDEEKMLDVAEQCFMRIADLLHQQQKTVKQAFLRFAEPEPFKDGTVLELIPPRAFLEGVREVGFEDVTEMEVACLMKVLAKPELDGAVILNEFVLIMENFGVPALAEEDEYENDYIPDSDAEDGKEKDKDKAREDATANGKEQEPAKDAEKKDEAKADKGADNTKEGADKEAGKADDPETKKDEEKGTPEGNGIADMKKRAAEAAKGKRGKHPIVLDFDVLDVKAVKILKKLARFLLERYMHPREFFGPTIKKEIIGKKKNKVEIIKHHDFYLRLKLASIRKKLKENETVNKFFAIDGERFPGFIQVKRMIKALEIIAEGEQELMLKEQEGKEKERKEAAEAAAKERAEKGLPPLEEEEPPKEGDAVKAKKKPEALDIPKPPTGGRGELDSMLKLGARGSPQNARDREGGLFGTGGLMGPAGQLNTIEEDLHETQTSHYSQAMRGEGDITDREGSKHQLSTSNQLRNSNALHELEDSARRSASGPGGSIAPAVCSAQSVDEAVGSRTSPQKLSMKVHDVRNSLPGNDAPLYPLEIDDADQRMKDELDAEVDKKYKRQLASSQDLEPLAGEGDDEYDDDFENKGDDEDMREDTIKTDKIEQIVEEDMKLKAAAMEAEKEDQGAISNRHSADASPRDQQILDELEHQSIDELDVQAVLEGGHMPEGIGSALEKAEKASTNKAAFMYVNEPKTDTDKQEDNYSDDEQVPPDNAPKSVKSPRQSDIEEDYEI